MKAVSKYTSDSLFKLTSLLYVFAFFDSFLVIYPLYTLLLSDSGMTATQISSLLLAWSATSFLLGLPAGPLADKYSKKYILLIGIAAKALGFFIWIIYPTYWGFLIGFVGWGVKTAFAQGTQQALIYEELKKSRQQRRYAKISGRMEALTSSGYILAGLAASLLAHFGYNLILSLSVGAIVVSGIAIFLLPVTPVVKQQASHYMAYVKDGFKVLASKSLILYAVLFSSIISGFGAMDEYFSLLFREKALSNSAISIWIAALFAAGAAGSLLAHRLTNRRLLTVPSLVLWAGLIGLASVVPTVYAPVVLCLYMFYFSAMLIAIMQYIQGLITDKSRATVLSVAGLVAESLSVLVYVMVAWGANHGGYDKAFQILAVSLLILAAGLWIGFRKPWLPRQKVIA